MSLMVSYRLGNRLIINQQNLIRISCETEEEFDNVLLEENDGDKREEYRSDNFEDCI